MHFISIKKRIKRPFAVFVMISGIAISSFSQITFDAKAKSWLIKSGTNEYRLFQKDSSIYLDNFGPEGSPAWSKQMNSLSGYQSIPYDFCLTTNGMKLEPKDFVFASYKKNPVQPDAEELVIMLTGRTNPISAEVHYTTYFQTGVFSKYVIIKNTGNKDLPVEKLPSLMWKMPISSYELTYMWGMWGKERMLQTETLRTGERLFRTTGGRSSSSYAPWFFLKNKRTGVNFAADLSYSGNWEMNFRLYPNSAKSDTGELEITMGYIFDGAGTAILKPGGTLQTPEVSFTSTAGDIDDATNQLHAYQRQYVFQKPTFPMLVQFNSWYPFQGNLQIADLKKCVDVAAKIGVEVFVVDAGWYNRKDWSRELGDWKADKTAFPKGLEELADYARNKGLKFGLWVEIENVGGESDMFKNHPDWIYKCNGTMINESYRYPLNINKPEVQQWMLSELNRLAKTYKLDWMKIDYNIDPGNCFDNIGNVTTGTVHYNNVLNYYKILDALRAENPNLVIESCASGGLRFDNGIMHHTHTNWLSDEVMSLPSLQLGYGCNTQFSCEVCNHWMVGDDHSGKIDSSCTADRFLFMLRVPMNGQFGISSRVFDWKPWMVTMAAEQTKFYKEHIRPVIMGSDIYHLTPQPDNIKPEGWMAIQYVSPDKKRSVMMVYRMQNSDAENNFKVRGLNPDATYNISIEQKQTGTFSGKQLMSEGININLNAVWSSAVAEIDEIK
jgi:alpha-galactosidase